MPIICTSESLQINEEIQIDKTHMVENSASTSNIQVKKVVKRVLVPWTVEQKRITESYFKTHIMKKIAPKKHEIMNLIETNPGIFDNKTYSTIKVYVYNKYKDKKL